MQSTFSKGVIFALSAAALNATIGVLSKVLMSNGFTASSVAVIKTLLGCVLLSILLFFLKRPAASTQWTQAAICAFLGIFVLFYFETSAYQHYAAAGVVVVLMASASISSIILGRIFLKDAITANATVGAALAIAGISVIFGGDLQQGFTLQGAALASMAGCGYGAFSVAMKRMGVSGAALHSTIVVLWQPVPADAGGGRRFRDGRVVAAGDRRAAGAGHAADNPGLLLHHQGHRVSQAIPSASAGADRATVRCAAGICGAQ